MAEVTPSSPKGTGAGVGGLILGGVLGLIVAVVLSVVGLTLSSAAWDTTVPAARGACGGEIVAGISFCRRRPPGSAGWHGTWSSATSRSASAPACCAGISVVVALYLLIPWPCSYTWAAFINFSACAR